MTVTMAEGMYFLTVHRASVLHQYLKEYLKARSCKILTSSQTVNSWVNKCCLTIFLEYGKLLFANDGNEPEWIDGKLHIGANVIDDIEEYQAGTGVVQPKEKITSNDSKDQKTDAGDVPVSKQIGNFLSFGGDLIKKGFTFVGQSIGQGIRSSNY